MPLRDDRGDTPKDGVVTVRHRDTMTLDRVKSGELPAWLAHAIPK